MAISVIGKIMGLLRDRQQAIHFGAHTAESIAFAQASVLPRTIFDIMFSVAFTASFIPVFVAYMEQKGKGPAYNLAALFMFVLTFLTVLIAGIGALLAGPIFRLSLGDADLPYGTIELGTNLLRIMFPIVILSGFAFFFAGILLALGEFRVTAAMSAVSNGIILIYFFFFLERFGVYGLAVSFLIGFFAQGVIQVPFLLRHKFTFKTKINLRDPGLRQIGLLAFPALAASWVIPINVLVNARAAAPLYGGQFGVNAIHYANTLYAIVSGVFILAVANVVFPKLSQQGANGDMDGFSETLVSTVRSIFFVLIPLSIFMTVLSKPIISLIFGGGLFGESAVAITASALTHYAPGIVGYGLMVILCRACFSLHDAKTPLLAAVIAIAINGVLSFLLAPVMMVAGPALANAVGSSAGAVVLIVILSKKAVLKWTHSLAADIVKMIFAGVLVFIAVWFASRLLYDTHVIFRLFIPAAVGGIVYFVCALLFKLSEAKWALEAVLKTFLR